MALYDTHAHLDFPDFAGETESILERAAAAGVTRIITIGTSLESSKRAVALSEKHPAIHAVVGWHPSEAMEAPDDVRPFLRELAQHPKVVALGETGRDYHRLPSAETEKGREEIADLKRKQERLFEQHLEVAAETGLNCVIHERDAFEDVFAQLQPWSGRLRGVFHCYVNTTANLTRILSIGSMVSFTGIVTFKNAAGVRESLAAAPMDAFMLETDCPFLAPMPYRGKRAEPAYVRNTAELVCAVRNCPMEELERATCETARRFFPKLS